VKQDYSPFSVALIDVFASALGIFMIFSAISLPFILNTDTSSNQDLSDSVDHEMSANVSSESTNDNDALEKLQAEVTALNSENKRLSQKVSARETIYEKDFSMELPVLFDGNQWYLRPEAKPIIDMMGRELSMTEVKVTIVGHTSGEAVDKRRFCLPLDEYGDASSDERVVEYAPIGQSFKRCFVDKEWRKELSTQRANTIKDHLIKHHGIAPSRVNAYGVGSQEHAKGIAANDSRNRRVEVTYSSSK
jgi:outer membrane protein OmpA-like peptidoglycan-associated protein